ncbi:MAG: hypothetical protein EA401_14215, partial [Planctomycetota bacterium]
MCRNSILWMLSLGLLAFAGWSQQLASSEYSSDQDMVAEFAPDPHHDTAEDPERIPEILAQERALGNMPVLHSGRVKPLSVAAREVVRAITGQGRFGPVTGEGVRMQVTERHAPVDLLVAWWRDPAVWRDLPLIEVPRRDVQDQLRVGRWSSIHDLMHGEQQRFLNRLRHEERHGEETGQRRRD